MTSFAPVEGNLRECFRALAGDRTNGDVRRLNGVEVLSLGVRFPMFNAAFLAFPVEDVADLERRITNAEVHFGARGVEWAFWMCDGMVPDAVNRRADRIFGARGMTAATQMPGMILPALAPPGRRMPSCEVREVADDATLADFREIGSRCFRVPDEWFAEVFDESTKNRAPFRAWVGYAAGKPAVTAATVAACGALGFYNVATAPEFRRLGYAEAVMRECIDRERGLEAMPLVLQSTASGLGLYRALGFRTVTRFRVWVS